jgi:hypothetical protein
VAAGDGASAAAAAFVAASLADSAAVQAEDTALCEAVQRGLRSGAYVSGRYAPRVEAAMFEFHKRLYAACAAAAGDSDSAGGGDGRGGCGGCEQ